MFCETVYRPNYLDLPRTFGQGVPKKLFANKSSLTMVQLGEKVDKKKLDQTFSAHSLPGPNLLKLSVPEAYAYEVLQTYWEGKDQNFGSEIFQVSKSALGCFLSEILKWLSSLFE